MKDYIKFIYEGLIITHNIEKYYNSLDIELSSIGVKSSINILSKFLYDLEIINNQELSNNILDQIININQNLLGYFPSYIWVKNDFGWNSYKFDKKYLNPKYISIKIRFESKYDDGLYKNDIDVPEIAYHISPCKNKEKISKNGLSPKSFNRKTVHTERIYLFDDLNNLTNLLKSMKLNDNLNNINQNYTLYQIEMNDKMIIHTDPNYKYGFYTYDNISPYKIKILKVYI